MSKKNRNNDTNNEENIRNEEEQNTKTSEIDITKFQKYIDLENELNQAKKIIKDSRDLVKNFASDIERIKQRSAENEKNMTKKITIEISKRLLPILDDFEKSFEYMDDDPRFKGFNMVYLTFKGVLDSLLVKQIVAAGDPINPDTMEIVFTEMAKNDEQKGTVSRVLTKGYIYEPTGEIIRYAKVAVYAE